MKRYNTKKCSRCKVSTSVLATEFERSSSAFFATDLGFVCVSAGFGPRVPCRGGCGFWLSAHQVLGRIVASKKCDGRCMAATGHQCECACGGKNHGSANA